MSMHFSPFDPVYHGKSLIRGKKDKEKQGKIFFVSCDYAITALLVAAPFSYDFHILLLKSFPNKPGSCSK